MRPSRSITQVRFAGPDLRDIYLNTVPANRGDTLKEGSAITRRNSILYRGRSEMAGRAIAPTRFTLD